jgi:opacity protein-like surface antigen
MIRGALVSIKSLAAAVVLASSLAAPAGAADIAVIRREVAVDAPASKIWARVGGYCAIAEWLKVACSMTSGNGELGSVRLLNNMTHEVMVAKTPWSYTYHQTVGNMSAFGYHGTLAVEPAGRSRSRLVYILIYDQETMTPEKRASERTRLEGRFQGALEAMKAIAERR